MSVSMPVLHHHDDCSFVVIFEIKKGETSTLFFFSIVFTIQSPLKFHMNLRISFAISEEKAIGNFDKYCIEFVDHFG